MVTSATSSWRRGALTNSGDTGVSDQTPTRSSKEDDWGCDGENLYDLGRAEEPSFKGHRNKETVFPMVQGESMAPYDLASQAGDEQFTGFPAEDMDSLAGRVNYSMALYDLASAASGRVPMAEQRDEQYDNMGQQQLGPEDEEGTSEDVYAAVRKDMPPAVPERKNMPMVKPADRSYLEPTKVSGRAYETVSTSEAQSSTSKPSKAPSKTAGSSLPPVPGRKHVGKASSSGERAAAAPIALDADGYARPLAGPQAASPSPYHRYEQPDKDVVAYSEVTRSASGAGKRATVLADPNRPLYFARFVDLEKDLLTLVKASRSSSKIFSILCCAGSTYKKETHIITRVISLIALKFGAQIIDENNQDNNKKAFKSRVDEIVNHIFPKVDKEDTTSVDMDKISALVEWAFITYVEKRIISMRGVPCFPDSGTLTQILLNYRVFKTIIERNVNPKYQEALRNVITLVAVRLAGTKIEEKQVRKKITQIISEVQVQDKNDTLTYRDWTEISSEVIKALLSCKNKTAHNATPC